MMQRSGGKSAGVGVVGWARTIGLMVLVVLVTTVLPWGSAVIGQKAWAEEVATEEVSQEVLDNLVQNCSSIKQSLRDLQRADSRTRTYLGSAYETIVRDFITPLNLRLVKNNRVDTKLFEIQGSFSEQQGIFRTEYTVYMRELENLIAMDCQADAKSFYGQLEKTREHRLKLHDVTKKLNQLVDSQYKGVEELRGKL